MLSIKESNEECLLKDVSDESLKITVEETSPSFSSASRMGEREEDDCFVGWRRPNFG
jgi:hypothetical protein